jgi:hypothetical protein
MEMNLDVVISDRKGRPHHPKYVVRLGVSAGKRWLMIFCDIS